MRRRLPLALALTSLIALGAATGPAAAALPPVGHVWIIQLENHSYDQTFNNSAHPYLWTTLRSMGQILPNYYGTGHASLDNYLTQLSGQAPNPQTQGDCPIYQDVLPGIMATDGQALGTGCVYPATVKTLVDQLEAKGLTWKGYMEDMGNTPSREPATCGNPQMGKADPTQTATAADQYAARHNPFVYFHSILDVPGRCAAHVVPLPPLSDDVKTLASTPNFSYITPNLCNDAHDATPCAGTNAKGTKEGDLVAADAFLAKWMPVITGSPAFKKDGLVIVTLDESSLDDASACCNEPAGLNTPFPGIGGPGGGRIGTLMISPYIVPGSTNMTAYNHYSFLASLENLYGISQHLGYAALPGLPTFGDDVFGRPQGGPVPGVPPLPADDLGSTGRAVPLRLRVLSPAPRLVASVRHGFRVRIGLKGTDRLTRDIGVRLLRGRAIVASSGPAHPLRGGIDTLRLAVHRGQKVRRGSYVLQTRAVHEGKVVRVVRTKLRLR